IVSVELRLAVGMMELSALKQARRAGMIGRRTRPEDAHVVLDLLVGHPAVVDRPALRRRGELGEDLAGARVVEELLLAEPLGELADDPPIGPRVTGRRHGVA